MNEVYYDLYKSNNNFRMYVDAFCKARCLGLFEALAYSMVHSVGDYYRGVA